MFDSASGYEFDSAESFNLLSEDARHLIYWCDLYFDPDTEDEYDIRNSGPIDKHVDGDKSIELYNIDDFYILVELSINEEKSPVIKKIYAPKSLAEFRKDHDRTYWNKNIGLPGEALQSSNEHVTRNNHTIYVGMDYDGLVKETSTFFEEYGPWEYDYKSGKRIPLIEKWSTSGNNFALLFLSRSDQDFHGSGVGLCTYNIEH